MTPKEKAQELRDKFFQIMPSQISSGTERTLVIACANIAVVEIINNIPMYLGNINPKWIYWTEVKKELEKL